MARPSLDALNEKRTGHITNHEDVLGYFDAVSPLTISEVAELASLSTSTVRRYVRDLVDAGYLVNGSTHLGHAAYMLGPEPEPEGCTHSAGWVHIGYDRYCASCGIDRDEVPTDG